MKKSKNKKSDKSKKSDFSDVLSKASTYSWDKPIFKQLGLTPFKNIAVRQKHYVGEIKLRNNSEVKIWVTPSPSLFWEFEIFVAESNKIIKISTGSGSFKSFWGAITMFAYNMLVVENCETKI